MAPPNVCRIRFGKTGAALPLPARADVLEGTDPPSLPNVPAAVRAALDAPTAGPSLAERLRARLPNRVAITVSDSTRPVPNPEFVPHILGVLREAGIPDSRIVVIVGTGMHRPGTPAEHAALLGPDVLGRVAVVDHRADAPETLVTLSEEPTIRVCKQFAEADFRIVTGFIEPHFMAGFSGGRKGVCPALVDRETIRRFHGFDTLASPKATNGVLAGNPCHDIALDIARRVGVDFLFNVAVNRAGRVAGIYCGDLEEAHLRGCADVARWVSVPVRKPYDLVVTSGGGAPLDRTFYQTVKGMCGALPALGPKSVLLQLSACDEGIGSAAYRDLMRRYAGNWRQFLRDAEANRHETALDQWEFQVQTRVLERIGPGNLFLATDGIAADDFPALCVTPVPGSGPAPERAREFVDRFVRTRPNATVAVIPDGPYTMLQTC